MRKKLTAILLSLAVLVTAAPVVTMNAAADTAEYAALGDSITSGYGLRYPDTQSYPSRFAGDHGLEFINYGVPGMTSQELLDALKNKEYDISGASVITVSIGSNDILDPVLDVVAKEMGLTGQEEDLNAAITARIDELYKTEGVNKLTTRFANIRDELKSNKTLADACDNVKNNTIPGIAAEIKAQNPDAQLIFTNIYNPYTGQQAVIPVNETLSLRQDVGALCQPYVTRINEGLKSNDDYQIADLESVFNGKPGYVNAYLNMYDMSKFTFDPHPTQSGHTAIWREINKHYTPKPEPTTETTEATTESTESTTQFDEPSTELTTNDTTETTTETNTETTTEEEFIYGDVNHNGTVDANDSAMVLQYTLNSAVISFSYEDTVRANVTLDDRIDAADAAQILQKALLSTHTFPVEDKF